MALPPRRTPRPVRHAQGRPEATSKGDAATTAMPRSAVTRLGSYAILAPLGAGGMREVYKATDTRLGRSVGLRARHPRTFFEGPYQNKALTHTGYDVAPDGRFVVIGDNSPQAEVLTVVHGWFEELHRLVPIS